MISKKEQNRRYCEKYPEKVKEIKKKWWDDNPKYMKEWKKNNPEYIRKMHLKYNYNLSHKDWLKMWEGQDGRCAICGKEFKKPSDANVDHNHKTDKVRGLLCIKCNFGIGQFNDDQELMLKAIRYLEKEVK